MGNIQASPGVDKSDLIQLFALELPFDTQFERQLGQGKILKTAKVKSTSRDGHLVIKVYVKPILSQSNQQHMEKLEEFIEKNKQKYFHIQKSWNLDVQPGLIPLIPIENKDKVQSHLHRGYFLGRQYFTYNLLDRFNTPPYLTIIEKKWIIYQLLRCIKQAHDSSIVHGDIKSENILLTSWGWCFLTDFNPYKPDNIPFDDPFQWSQFFEDSRRPRCYLAPERFYTGKNDGSSAATLLPVSDMFSLGCVIAEIFMDGQVLFDLSQLLKYKTHGFDQYDPTVLLAKKIDDKQVRELIEHCINLDAKARWAPQRYLDFYRGKIFPAYFDDLYELFKKFLNVAFSEADHKIKYIQKKYVDILRMVSSDCNKYYKGYNFNACVPELFRKDTKRSQLNKSNMSLASPTAVSPNYAQMGIGAAGDKVPQLEIIMRQQKLQQTVELTQLEDAQNEAGTDNDEFVRLTDYDDDEHKGQDKLSGIGLALQTQKQQTSTKPILSSTKSPLSRRRRRSSGISTGLASVVSAAYKGNDTRLLNDADIQELTERLNTMTAAGNAVNFINKDGNLIVDMSAYQSHPTNKTDNTNGNLPSPSHKNTQQQTPKDLRRQMEAKRKNVINIKSQQQQQKMNMLRNIEGDVQHTSIPHIFPDDEDEFDGLILMSNVVCSCLRNCRKASNRLVALEILGGFALYLSDDIRLDRLVPYIRALIHDDKKKIHEEHSIVVAKSIEVMSNILSRVIHVPSKYTRLFPDYILETLKLLVDNRREEIIRIEIARQLANLALTGKYFIDYRDKDREITLDNMENNTGNDNVDEHMSVSTLTNDLFKLRTKVSQLIDPLFGVDQYPSVQRALLSNCTRLCEFLGAKFTESKLIPGLFTFFNRKEWQLRVSFLDVVVGISFYIGKESLHKVLLPCLEECLNDARPAVVERCLEAFTSLTEMKIFESQLLLSRIQQIVPLVVHYSAWVRNACINFLLTAANMLGDVRAHCRMLPVLEPYLEYPIVFINRQTLTASLKAPLSLDTFNLLISNHGKKNLDEIICAKKPQLFDDQPLYDGILSYIGCIKYFDQDEKDNINNIASDQKDLKQPRLYSIMIEPTVRIYIPNMAPVSQAVMLANNPQTDGSGDIDEADQAAWQDLNHSIQSITSHGQLPFVCGAGGAGNSAVKHPRQVDDTKIREALELPPSESIGQDKLVYNQISKCSFYKNHQPPYMSHSILNGWKPRGRVITQLREHEDSVNIMRVSRDNLFVATASNDSTVKIWSCDKMHRCASIKSEQTYSHQKGEIISLAILDSSHSIASGSRDGTIHCFRVEHDSQSDSFAGLQYKFTLDPEEGGVVCMEHFNTFTESLIVFGTQAGNIHGWDIRRKKLSFALPMEPAMGAITSMCIGPSIHSVIVGTARGFIVLFDLRFEFPVQMWRHYDASPIVSLTVLNSKTILPTHKKLQHPVKGPLVLISTQRSNEICAFDLTTGTCRVRFRNSITKQLSNYNLNNVNSNHNLINKKSKNKSKKNIFSSILNRNTFASSIAGSSGNTQLGLKISQLPSVYPAALGQCPATRPFSLPSFEASNVLQNKNKSQNKTEYKSSEIYNNKRNGNINGGYVYNCGFVPTVLNRALNVNVIGDELEQLCSDFGNEHGGSTGVLISKEEFIICAGRDRVVRYWDLQEPNKSFRISNTTPNTIFTYNAYQDKKYNEVVFEELIEFEQEDYADLNDENEKKHHQSTISLNINHNQSKSVHQDIITDLKAIQYPQNMLLTSSRNGIVKVWI